MRCADLSFSLRAISKNAAKAKARKVRPALLRRIFVVLDLVSRRERGAQARAAGLDMTRENWTAYLVSSS